MSLVDLSLKISHFNISIHIHRDEKRKESNLSRKIYSELMLKEALERRNRIQIDYSLLDILR